MTMNATADRAGTIGAHFGAQLREWQSHIERELDARLPPPSLFPERLHEAMRYSVLGGGKRVRAVLVYATAAALRIPESRVDGAACAVELIHAYSLVHDDLPAMDDDDMRRGRPACHKAFDEATAILAGDALQVLAFEALSAGPGLPDDPKIRLKLVELLARASGPAGMAGGQALDLAAMGRTLSIADIEQMHALKTGALIRASVTMAAACDAAIDAGTQRSLDTYAEAIGLAFQIKDDLLDIEGDPTLLGKATGADLALNKPTYPSIAGVDAARQRMHELHARALESLNTPRLDAAPLASVSDWLVLRKH
jgi:farnesyl diphosphate synthase